jgi:GT2 family glycosyltransferase
MKRQLPRVFSRSASLPEISARNSSSGGTGNRQSFWRNALLTLSVHFDAARAEPRRYAITIWWRLRGKRVRARSQFARLLGRSPSAYDYWIAHQETAKLAAIVNRAPLRPVVALVEASDHSDDLSRTLESLDSQQVATVVVGHGQTAGSWLSAAERLVDGRPDLWLIPMRAGDLLAKHALVAYGDALAGADARVAYADDDILLSSGRRTSPHFKPNWNSELFCHFDFLSNSCIIRPRKEDLLCVAAGNGDELRALLARLCSAFSPLRVPQVLHHLHSRPKPKVPGALQNDTARGISVSVIVPTRNRVDLLRTCVEGLARTDWPNLELIIVDNESDDPHTLAYLDEVAVRSDLHCRVLKHSGAFNFSAINNRAVAQAQGEVLCLLNNDIEVLDPNWLGTMVCQALREEVGAVGAKLFYPNGRIQHAGVVIGMGGAAGHAHRFLSPGEDGYFQRHKLPQFVSAVTAACLVVRRDRYLAVGGLDEANFAVAFNDVDLCLRLNSRGWQSFYEPRAALIHHESVSRGFDRDPVGARRLAGELGALKHVWKTDTIVDPFHHPELSRASEQFVIGL